MTEKEKFVEEIIQSEYEDAVHTNFHVPMETVVKRVAEQAWDAGAASAKKNEWHNLEEKEKKVDNEIKIRVNGGEWKEPLIKE